MSDSDSLPPDFEQAPAADHVFDGGGMDCGSGLVLLIREHVQQVPVGGVLEIRSSEPTVAGELPPWCRMVGHQHLGSIEPEPGNWRHFVKRGEASQDSAGQLESDKEQARSFRWSLRARPHDATSSTVYARNLSWSCGRSVSFDRRDQQATALEQLLGALLGDLMAGFRHRCEQFSWDIDELEATLQASLANPLAAVGNESGSPALEEIQLVFYVTTSIPVKELQSVWQQSLAGSPVYATLDRACRIEARFVPM